MPSDRRTVLRGIGTVAVGLGLAGCSSGDAEEETPTGTASETTAPATTTQGATGGSEGQASVPAPSADTAVAATWNTYRSRVYDAVTLARAGDPSSGAALAQELFADFENAGGEYGAHEKLEATDESAYGGFEGALSDLRSELSAGNVDAAARLADRASTNLLTAQRTLVGDRTARAFDVLLVGARANDVRVLTAAGATDAAAALAGSLRDGFDGSAAYDVLAQVGDADAVVAALSELADAVDAGGDVPAAVASVRSAAVDGARALTGSATASADAGRLAALSSRGYDAAALASLGGPGSSFTHASTLSTYRAVLADVPRLVAAGETQAAASIASEVFAHFEGADAHGALEAADTEAYEGFEGGLKDLRTAAEQGDAAAASDAFSRTDGHLVTGIGAIASGLQATVLQAGFFRARLADAKARYDHGDAAAAESIAAGLFERFEANELGFHERLERTDESLYERFEETHLKALIDAAANGDDGAVATHYEGADAALADFETAAASTAVVAGAETTYLLGRAFDAAALAVRGESDAASASVEDALAYFEGGASGVHEALEAADHEVYESYESALAAVGGAESPVSAAFTFHGKTVAAVDAVVSAAGGDYTGAAAAIAQGVFESFETAAVHDRLEAADQGAYEAFEKALDAHIDAVKSGSGVSASAGAFGEAAVRAQFAVVGALSKAPVGESSGGGSQASYEGGPNVQQGVPEDADHVVELRAVAFEPAELTVKVGDTVAWEHTAGEPHSVSAYEDGIPEDADYWASGGFDSEKAARTGWENKKGAVQSGQSYVHTFETAGEHQYFCIPHEAAGMVGKVIVEE